MDIRGIEVTNQLRSAIRAKLLELGVRYDEELPDYILVMVVNKKTRQQMHEDLHLFLEDSTTPFVEWLHDQVLKKLQKVTVAKKKSTREFVPTVVVKQEEERKKRKNNASTSLDEASIVQSTGKILGITTKEEKTTEKNEKSLTSLTVVNEKLPDNNTIVDQANLSPKIVETENNAKTNETSVETTIPEKITNERKFIEAPSKTTKRPLDSATEISARIEKRPKSLEPSKNERPNINDEKHDDKYDDDDDDDGGANDKSDKKLKSCVNKPKVTSVVSVKTRLGAISPRKKFETHRNRFADETRARTQNHNERNFTNFPNSRGNNRRSMSHDEHDDYSRSRNNAFRNRQSLRIVDARNRQYPMRNEDKTFLKNSDTDKSPRNNEKMSFNVKDRLGNCKTGFSTKKTVNDATTPRNERVTIKNRLGIAKNRSATTLNRRSFSANRELAKIFLNDDTTIDDDNDDDDDDDDDYRSIVDIGPVKSRIIAIRRPEVSDKRANMGFGEFSNGEKTITAINDDNESGKTIASKVIVTPRPLKPLQPVQKRATQSLLLRAVAEANKSVVKQKNPEPVLTDNKPRPKRPRPPSTREIGKNLSVHLNATKRIVMEKIQVQLSTTDTEDNNKNKQYISNPVNEEHMGVVMSLFQRSDDNQKFLVTLNGYNNNVIKEKRLSEDDEERMEMEVTEDDEMAVVSNVNSDSCEQIISSPTSSSQINENDHDDNAMTEKIVIIDENNENHNIENVEIMENVPERKRRKLSPIVYTRSRSGSPEKIMTVAPITMANTEIYDKRTIVDVAQSSGNDKSRDQCRYWPNCTLGTKCSYYHPGVPCSAFPGCKYGEKCVYKHPNCKFGLACTKLGCAFSHPKQQCKYHPFCTKPTCPYSHPTTVVTTDTTRAKFTWKRRD